MSDGLTRERVHTRRITCENFLRSDGLWEVVGTLTDIRDEAVKTPMLDLAPGQAMHDLTLVMVIDLDLTIRDLHTGFTATATPDCHQIGDNYRALIGTPIASGFSRRLREAVGATRGCTHMTALLQAMATSAIQGLWHDRPETRDAMPEWLVNSCHGYRAASEAVRLMGPAHYQPDEGAAQ